MLTDRLLRGSPFKVLGIPELPCRLASPTAGVAPTAHRNAVSPEKCHDGCLADARLLGELSGGTTVGEAGQDRLDLSGGESPLKQPGASCGSQRRGGMVEAVRLQPEILGEGLVQPISNEAHVPSPTKGSPC